MPGASWDQLGRTSVFYTLILIFEKPLFLCPEGYKTFIMSEEKEEKYTLIVFLKQCILVGILIPFAVVGYNYIRTGEVDWDWDSKPQKTQTEQTKPSTKTTETIIQPQTTTPTLTSYKKRCTSCGGTGRCGTCNGTGSYPCDNHDTNQDGYCTECNNRGTLICYFHSAGGLCDRCEGDGYIIAYR